MKQAEIDLCFFRFCYSNGLNGGSCIFVTSLLQRKRMPKLVKGPWKGLQGSRPQHVKVL